MMMHQAAMEETHEAHRTAAKESCAVRGGSVQGRGGRCRGSILRSASIGAVLLFAGVLLVFSISGCTSASATTSASGTTPADDASSASSSNGTSSASVTMDDGVQKVDVSVNNRGYSPNAITLQAGVPAEITFSKASGCLGVVQSSSLGFEATLSSGPQTVEIASPAAGTYTFACGMNMYSGTITVK